MRAVEVMGLVVYFYSLQEGIKLYTTWLDTGNLRDIKNGLKSKIKDENIALDILLPPGFTDGDLFQAWRGRSLEWCFTEIMVFIFFVSTMLNLIIKSRFFKVGIDHSHQFAPTYMSYLANRIALMIDFDFYEKYLPKDKTKELYTNKITLIHIDGTRIRVKIDPQDYDKLWHKAYLGENTKLVDIADAAGWINRNLIGDITVDDLNSQRRIEINSLDLMQNSSIIYHSESIIEMQILCLIFSVVAQSNLVDYEAFEESKYIIGALLFEHLFSYAFHIFRLHDIKHNCKVDVNGVKRAPRESFLQMVEIFYDCILIGYIIKYLIDMKPEHFHGDSYIIYWVIVDCMLMFFSQGYNYLC